MCGLNAENINRAYLMHCRKHEQTINFNNLFVLRTKIGNRYHWRILLFALHFKHSFCSWLVWLKQVPLYRRCTINSNNGFLSSQYGQKVPFHQNVGLSNHWGFYRQYTFRNCVNSKGWWPRCILGRQSSQFPSQQYTEPDSVLWKNMESVSK